MMTVTMAKKHEQPAIAKCKETVRGKVPGYLKKRAVTLQSEADARKHVKIVKQYPPGTRLLTEEERLSTLANLE